MIVASKGKMRKSSIALMTTLLLASGLFTAIGLVPRTNAVQVATNSLELHLFAPVTATPGQVIQIELWTIFENTTSQRSDLAFNNTSVGVANTTLSFAPKTNVGTVPPHIHTPAGAFIKLAPFTLWTHPGAWSTNYTVPSQTGLYGVHVYANYSVVTGNCPARCTSYVTQAETTFLVQDSLATASSLSGVGNVGYAILGLIAVAVVLELLVLFWKKSPAKA